MERGKSGEKGAKSGGKWEKSSFPLRGWEREYFLSLGSAGVPRCDPGCVISPTICWEIWALPGAAAVTEPLPDPSRARAAAFGSLEFQGSTPGISRASGMEENIQMLVFTFLCWAMGRGEVHGNVLKMGIIYPGHQNPLRDDFGIN